MAYVDTGGSIADDTVVLRELKTSPLNTGEFDSSLQVIVTALNDLNSRVIGITAGDFTLPETSATIASGVITPSETGSQNCIVDTEGSAATDDLTRLSGLDEGILIILQSTSAGRVITVTHGTYLRLASGRNFILNDVNDSILLRVASGGICKEISRSSND